MVLVGALVTVEAPSTVKLDRSAPMIVLARAASGVQARAARNERATFWDFKRGMIISTPVEKENELIQ
jgi:hypothetical protein